MSVYNGANYLKEAVESILNQTFSEFEFIIIDDGSKDETWDILNNYASSDYRIKLIKNRINIGLTRSLNKGLVVARGKYIARQDHDDFSEPTRLEKETQYLDMHDSTVLVSCNYDIINSEGKIVKRTDLRNDTSTIYWNLIFYNYLGGHSQVMFRRDPVLKIGGYSESLPYAQDYDLWLRLSKFGHISILPEILLKYRIHDKRVTSTAGDTQFECVLNISASRIADLTGRRPELLEVQSIWSFWCLVYESELQHTSLSTNISIQLTIRKIFKAFIAEHQFNKSIVTTQSVRAIRNIIAKRCLNWSRSVSTKKHKIWAWLIMLAAYIYWLRFDLIKILINKIYSLYIKNIFENRSHPV